MIVKIKDSKSVASRPETMEEIRDAIHSMQIHILDRKKSGSKLYRRLEEIEARLNVIESRPNSIEGKT